MSKAPHSLTEFAIIDRFFSSSARSALRPELHLGVGDDCALLTIPEGQQLAISIDTMVEGRHFPADADAGDIGYRALAVATSDLAAMGAAPLAATLALTLPCADEAWLEGFSRGFHSALGDFSMSLIGGDTTCGPLTITVQVHGVVPQGCALLRSGARVGDKIVVSGALGDAAAALAGFDRQLELDETQSASLHRRFYRPQPRIGLGQSLLSLAHSAIDISDGLLADLGHIVQRSAVGARIAVDALPLSTTLCAIAEREQALQWALTGGDDYELCFTLSADNLTQLKMLASDCGVDLTVIGDIVAGDGVQVLDTAGREVQFASGGFQHFGND